MIVLKTLYFATYPHLLNFQWLFALIFVWYNQMNAYSSGYSVHMTACQREYISKVLSMFLFIIFCCDFVSMAVSTYIMYSVILILSLDFLHPSIYK